MQFQKPNSTVTKSIKLTFGSRTIRCRTELILLRICTSKDEIANKVESKNGTEFNPADTTREINQIASLQGISEWDPSIQTESKHETETIYKSNIYP